MTDDVTRPFDARPAGPPPGGPPAPPVGEAVPDLRDGLGLLSRGLIAYGVIALIVAGLGLALLLYANTRIDAAGDRVETSVAQLTTTLDATAQALHDASTTAATFNTTLDRTQTAVAAAADTIVGVRTSLQGLESVLRSVSILGTSPLGGAANAVGGIASSIEGLDSKLTAIADGLATGRDSLAANADSLGALGDSIAATSDRLAIGRRRGFARGRPCRDRAHAIRPDCLGSRPRDRRPGPRCLAAPPPRGGRRRCRSGPASVRGGARPLAQLVAQGGSGGEQPTHPVDAAAGWCR